MSQKPSDRYESQCLLPEAEQHQQLVEWNNTHSEYPQNWSIHQWFEAQVELTPDAIALSARSANATDTRCDCAKRTLRERTNLSRSAINLPRTVRSLQSTCSLPAKLRGSS